MANSHALLVTDDSVFLREMTGILDSAGWKVDGVSVKQWLAGSRAASNDRVNLLDLRDDPLWSALADASRVPTRGLTVGLIDETIPLQYVKAGELHLDATVSCSPASNLAARLLRCLDGRTASSRRHNGEFECRTIRTASYEFRTYTPALFETLDQLHTAARHDFTILIVGETGTGKTTLAAMIHELSSRREARLLTVACGALPGELIDSELFGHIQGSFTGADRTKEGKFEASEEGTILLDEIDVLGLVQQAKLLRVLETGQFEPVGSNETKTARCRTVVASNVDLESLIEDRRFRSDLYFRLNQVKFVIPPLRERPMDIVPLATDFVNECCREHGLSVQRVHPDFLRILRQYSWPGNIRQLRNEVRRAVLFSRDGVITPEALSLEVLKEAEQLADQAEPAGERSALAQQVALTERQTIERMLREQNFNRAATARALGISRVTLYNKLKKFRMMSDSAAKKEGDD